MAEAITLWFIAPLLIRPLAHPSLGETMGGPVLLAALPGFAAAQVNATPAP